MTGPRPPPYEIIQQEPSGKHHCHRNRHGEPALFKHKAARRDIGFETYQEKGQGQRQNTGHKGIFQRRDEAAVLICQRCH